MLFLLVFCSSAFAQSEPPTPEFFKDIGVEQKIGQILPLESRFIDETGDRIQLKELVGEKPLVLALVYFECPMLCTQVLNGLLRALNVLTFTVGQEFDVVAVSFNPKETSQLAQAKKKVYLNDYRGGSPTASGWHFLTGQAEAIDALTEAVGFQYVYDSNTEQYAHPSTLIIITPDGRVSRYLFGVEYSGRDLRLALVEASQNKLGTVVEQLLLMCFQYDPSTGKYSLFVLGILRIFALLTLFALVSAIAVFKSRELRAKKSTGKDEP